MHILLFFILLALVFPGLMRFLLSLIGLAILCVFIVAAAHAAPAPTYKTICISSLDGKRNYIAAKCDSYAEEQGEYSCEFKTKPPAVCFIENGCFVCN